MNFFYINREDKEIKRSVISFNCLLITNIELAPPDDILENFEFITHFFREGIAKKREYNLFFKFLP